MLSLPCNACLLQVPPPQPRVFVISGPSGVGKDAVLKHLQQRRPDLHFVVTATSRYVCGACRTYRGQPAVREGQGMLQLAR
jgi:hypothetical protein